MENNFNRRIPTDLDLNGPVLSYTTQPTNQTKARGDAVTFTVAATTSFPGNSAADGNDSGTITFQWYEATLDDRVFRPAPGQSVPTDRIASVRQLTNGADGNNTISGATSASLTISNLDTPDDDNRHFVCDISYTPGDEYDSADKGTGAALNTPLRSTIGTVEVNPLLEITTQPSSATVYINTPATFTIGAQLTDNTKKSLSYAWYVGVGGATPTLVENKTYTTQNVTQETVTVIVDETVTDTTTHGFAQSYGPGNHEVVVPPTGYNVNFSIAGASGGGGGSDAGGSGGTGGRGRQGFFTVPNGQAQGQPFLFKVGNSGGGGNRGQFWSFGSGGAGGTASGGRGGGAGPRGWSGGGGGGGGASGVIRNGVLIASGGGGGGGGGGSLNRPASNGFDANNWFAYNGGTITSYGGGSGGDCPNDGGGGGGGGAGSGGPAGGGHAGRDNSHGGGGGGGGNSDYRADIISLTRSDTHGGNGSGYMNFAYTTSSTRPVQVPREVIQDKIIYQNTKISGQGTPTLTIESDNADFNTDRSLYCVVSSTTASNSPLTSDTVTSSLSDPSTQDRLIIETISADGTANIQETNLLNGEEEIVAGNSDRDLGSGGYLHSLYSPDKDLDVEMDLYGGKGSSTSGKGGEGGYSRIRFTMKKQQEYIIAGLDNTINTPFLYSKALLLAVVGGGGDGGMAGDGGKGGGIGVSGQQGRNVGALGGSHIVTGTSLPTNGTWSHPAFVPATGLYAGDSANAETSTQGGQTIRCTKGDYWARLGISPCDVVPGLDAASKFRMADGTEISNTGSIFRGYKDGYAIQNTGGLGRASRRTDSAFGPPTHASGGNGATGGSGGLAGQSGGGGSGYSNGEVTIVSTQLGGSTFDKAKVIIRRDSGDTPVGDGNFGLYEDSAGRLLILSTNGAGNPNDLPIKTGVINPGDEGVIDDVRWRRFLDLARDGMQDYRLTLTLNRGVKAAIPAEENNIYRMMNANQLSLRDSLARGWVDMAYVSGYEGRRGLAWHEADPATITGGDYSLLWYASGGGWGAYGWSGNRFFKGTIYHLPNVNYWILPPGVPDFPYG
tara:strand:+ start:13 stop:3204 length:3192 start_codon:yes stop_codon:yes gene_type:complete